MFETFQRLDKSFLQEPKELGKPYKPEEFDS